MTFSVRHFRPFIWKVESVSFLMQKRKTPFSLDSLKHPEGLAIADFYYERDTKSQHRLQMRGRVAYEK